MRTIERSTQFKRDYKREARGRHGAGLDALLIPILRALASNHVFGTTSSAETGPATAIAT